MHIDGKLLVLIGPVMKSGLDIGAFQKSSRARPGLTQWLRVLVTCMLAILGPRVPLKRGAAAAARAAPLHPAWHTLAAPAPPRRFCALGAGQLGRGLGSQPPCRGLVSLAGDHGRRGVVSRPGQTAGGASICPREGPFTSFLQRGVGTQWGSCVQSRKCPQTFRGT